MAKPSKNQRAGQKTEPVKTYCDQGHVMRSAQWAARGRKLMIWVCDCTFPEIKKEI